MADYIDREELLKALKKEFRQNDYIKHDSYFEFKNIVETMPTVEQKHGHWIVRTNFGDGCLEVRCSECGKTGFWRNQPLYCPYCGSKNDEVTE